MAGEITPGEIRATEFRTALRGLDATEVQDFLERIASELESLTEQRDRLAARAGEYGDRDLESEFEHLGREVTAVLQSAREAAEAMRERASLDAARWRSESMAEAERVRKDARNDAEALRGDAWTTGTELLTQTTAEIKRLRAESERDVLTVMGEAEREAHRLTSSARREAEDLTRNARMDAEKTVSDATKRRDDLIEQAHRQASAAEERTRALEQRREELLEELENVRSTLSRLEGTLEERRDDLNLSASDSATVRVVPTSPAQEERTWEPGETVRIVNHADEEPIADVESETDEVVAEALAAPEPATEPEPEPEPAPQPEPEPEPSPEPVPEPAPSFRVDEVGALFASLRGHEVPVTAVATAPEPVSRPPQPTKSAAQGVDWVEQRDSLLLPITNRALRGVKKAVTDAQNIALDSLRTDASWTPDPVALSESMRADVIGLWAESFAAGHSAAEQMIGERVKRPSTPSSRAAEEIGESLSAAVNEALSAAGEGQRERQSATSRVFRGWRTDEAERRTRELALKGYHEGIAASLPADSDLNWVAAGTICSACAEASANPRSSLPPVHPGCECTVALS